MKISIEDGDLIYIYLIDPKYIKSISTITNVNGYLIHDQPGNWLGFRVEKSQDDDRKPIELPPFVKGKFLTVELEEYIDILFVEGVNPDQYYEQECHLDVSNGAVVGIEIIMFTWNPKGRNRWILPYKS